MQVYYFSGTGNSLYISKQLQSKINNTELVPIIHQLQHERIESRSDTVGIVFPIHCLGLPIPVVQFLKRLDLKSATYIFAIATRECSSKVFKAINKILIKQNKSLQASFSIEMPETYIPMFEVYTKEHMDRTESTKHQKLNEIIYTITNKRVHLEHDKLTIGIIIYYLLSPMVRFVYLKTRYFNVEKRFYANKNCTGCGTCEKICLSNKIQILNNKPKWNDGIYCAFCFACIHYCPAKAIQIDKRKTITRGRYNHPEITSNDIAAQK